MLGLQLFDLDGYNIMCRFRNCGKKSKYSGFEIRSFQVVSLFYITMSIIEITQSYCYFCNILAVNLHFLVGSEGKERQKSCGSIYFLEGDAVHISSSLMSTNKVSHCLCFPCIAHILSGFGLVSVFLYRQFTH
jgi:hypothetical protein